MPHVSPGWGGGVVVSGDKCITFSMPTVSFEEEKLKRASTLVLTFYRNLNNGNSLRMKDEGTGRYFFCYFTIEETWCR